MITEKQHRLLLYLNEKITENGYPPSYEELQQAMNLKSKSGIHRLIASLEERGFVRRIPYRARAVEVIRLPGSPARKTIGQTTLPDNVIPAKFLRADTGKPETHPEAVTLPLYGRIAAGTPIEALRDHSTTVEVPAGMLGDGEHYALEIEGDSMIDAGILDGDTAIIQRCETADNGAIIVALIDGVEATLKRLRKRGKAVALEPANSAYETRIFRPDQVVVQGRLRALMRAY